MSSRSEEPFTRYIGQKTRMATVNGHSYIFAPSKAGECHAILCLEFAGTKIADYDHGRRIAAHGHVNCRVMYVHRCSRLRKRLRNSSPSSSIHFFAVSLSQDIKAKNQGHPFCETAYAAISSEVANTGETGVKSALLCQNCQCVQVSGRSACHSCSSGQSDSASMVSPWAGTRSTCAAQLIGKRRR